MISVADLVRSLPGLLGTVVPAPGAAVDDITLAELDRGVVGIAGDLTLGVGVDETTAARRLVLEAAARQVPAVVLRAGVAHQTEVVDAATRHGIALVELAEHVSWAHVVWLLRGLLDRSLGQGGELGAAGTSALSGTSGIGAPAEELFAIADAAAGLVGGPVTIEDGHSRVLAYSSRQESTDPARVSTIVGRRVPDAVLSHLRTRGVFRRMVASPRPFFVPESPDSPVGARYVIPVHAGGEWLGSIWALVAAEPAPETILELERTAAIVALHLLRLRSQADLSRRVAMDRLRQAMTGTAPDDAGAWLPPGPWRVVALTSTDPLTEPADVARRLDTWEAIFRRQSWPQPRLVDISDEAFALVRDDGQGAPTQKSPPGSWTWLRRVMAAVAADGSTLTVGAGAPAMTPAELPRSLAQARSVARALRAGHTDGPSRGIEEAWVPITLDHATQSLGDATVPDPLSTLARHDETEGTAYLPTLAAWLDHLGAASEAAAWLGIHANTLRYRMARLTELLDPALVDLSDPRNRLALRLHLLALKAPGQGPADARRAVGGESGGHSNGQ